MKTALICLAAAFTAGLAGCSTNPITGRSQLMLVSEESAERQSATAYQQMIGGLAKKGQIEHGTARALKVQQITDRLVAQAIKLKPASAKWRWEVQVINDPKTVNAWCMAGGKMAIYTGLIDQLRASDDEIAQVMGHEISHALAEHTRERMSVAYSTGAATTIAAIALGAGDLAAQGMQAAAVYAIQMPNSRESEAEADQIGIEIAARAGFEPKSAVTLWEKMGKLGGGRQPEFMSTHPSPEHRAEALKQLGAKVQPYYAAAKANPPAPARHVNLGGAPGVTPQAGKPAAGGEQLQGGGAARRR
jgi:predicted Zn-dependent protease